MFDELKEETKRKIGRIIVGTILIAYGIYLNNTYGIELTRNTFFFVVMMAIFLDLLRVDFGVKFPIFYNQFPMRPTEKKGVHGTTFAGLGCLLAITFFDFDIAITAIAISIYGDSFAAIFGKISGKGGFHTHEEKTIAGSLAMFITAIVVGFIFLENIILILTIAIIATLLEMFVKNLPDDLILCPFSAACGQLAAALMGLRAFPSGFPNAMLAWGSLTVAYAIFYYTLIVYKKLHK